MFIGRGSIGTNVNPLGTMWQDACYALSDFSREDAKHVDLMILDTSKLSSPLGGNLHYGVVLVIVREEEETGLYRRIGISQVFLPDLSWKLYPDIERATVTLE